MSRESSKLSGGGAYFFDGFDERLCGKRLGQAGDASLRLPDRKFNRELVPASGTITPSQTALETSSAREWTFIFSIT